MRLNQLFIFALMVLIFGCSTDKKNHVFKIVPANVSGIDFSNDLIFDQEFNIFRYRNFYNGGGVAIADFNNDSLSDIYLISNKIYN